ncbi:MAG: hypothetical protein F9K38_06765, partial [Pseudorhodoplanes sp.]
MDAPGAGALRMTGSMQNLQSAFGLAVLLAIAWSVSENRFAVSWRRAGASLALTVVLALVLLKIPPVKAAVAAANGAV